MSARPGNEQRFVAEVDDFKFIAHDMEHMLRRLDAWLARLNHDLETQRLACAGLKPGHALARQAEAINTALQANRLTWSKQWAGLEPARVLADAFDDKAMLLVFGKFNAGKSSFCNFLADRFAAHGKTVRYFYIDAGRIIETPERFKEGVTETTARLQGVRLGEKLILLDTPGLHSITPENAALTQRFTDSADGVLWLTSSTSPGQVQELDELARELHRNKPLLPIVTRSDVFEEDEIDGEIKKFLRNKTPQNRAQQEADVTARAQEKLVSMAVDVALLESPVSISSYMAREQKQTPAAMEEAGFERLYAALLSIAEPALAYKRRKAPEVLLHHLQENVLGALHAEVLPQLGELTRALQSALDQLGQQETQLTAAAWRGVAPALPALLEKHSASGDVQAACGEVSQMTFEAFARAVGEQLADCVITLDVSLARVELDDAMGFERIEVAVGTQSQVVGVDYQRLHAALEKAVHKNLLGLAGHAVGQYRASVQQLMEDVAQMENTLHSHEQELLALKRELQG